MAEDNVPTSRQNSSMVLGHVPLGKQVGSLPFVGLKFVVPLIIFHLKTNDIWVMPCPLAHQVDFLK